MLVYYPLRFWMIPELYYKRKKVVFGLLLLLHIVLVYIIYWRLMLWVLSGTGFYQEGRPFEYAREFLIRSLRFLSPSVLLLVWEYQHNRKLHLSRIRELEKEKLNTEIKYLKAQINPHFLFNTLNNLYSFVITKSPKAHDLIDRLTGILDYVLIKSQQDVVPLQSEVQTIGHYLELEKVRYGERLQVAYYTEGIKDQPISPLILLSIIENAFKHGASGDIDQPHIKVHITAQKEQIDCEVWNTKSKYTGEINDEYKKGIGLTNIRRQLDLIYPNCHKINIQDQLDFFKVNLTLNTAL